MKILVSKCLLGENCRYCGDNCKNEHVLALKARYTLVGVCPEQDGGLPTPRQPAERLGEKVIARDGRDVTREYEAGEKVSGNGVTAQLLLDNGIPVYTEDEIENI